MSVQVFVSVGKRYKGEQRRFVTRIRAELKASNLKPATVPHSTRSDRNLLEPIRSKMQQCFGVVVIAFPRISMDRAREWPDSACEAQLTGRSIATVWLQIEAAIAFEMGKPLLILVDDRLHPEGLLNPKHAEYGAHYFNMGQCEDGLPCDLVTSIRSFSEQVKALATPT